MNIHPIIIHFPIACLILYTMIEVLGLFSSKVKINFVNTKYFLLFVWVVGAFVALQTWEIAEHLMSKSSLIETHSLFANLTYFAYTIISIFYLIRLAIDYRRGEKYRNQSLQKKLPQILSVLNNQYSYYIIVMISIVWSILLSITGALGGAISHWPNADPMVRFVYDMLISQ